MADNPSTADPTPPAEAWRALHQGAQPLWQTIQQWTVALILTGIIAMGCYTMLLTWPLTQPGSKLEIAHHCAQTTAFNGYTGQIYRLVTDPCQDRSDRRDDEKPTSIPDPQAGDAAPAPASGPDEANLDAGGAAQPTQAAAPGAQDGAAASNLEAGPGETAGEGVAKAPENEGTEPESSFAAYAPSREPNALFMAVLAAGITGGAVYSLRSHTIHVARGTHDHHWGLWNLSRPFLGGALAVILFFLIRAGFVENGEGGALRPEGFIALAALTGLFTDQAWSRMRIVAESVFAKRDEDTRSRPADPVEDAAPSNGSTPTDSPGQDDGPGRDDGPEGGGAPDQPPART